MDIFNKGLVNRLEKDNSNLKLENDRLHSELASFIFGGTQM